jgi:hypothetical protein
MLKLLRYSFRGYEREFFLSIVFPHLLQAILVLKVTIVWHINWKYKSEVKDNIIAVPLLEPWHIIW